jgi:polysaccharide pyruvyl transferase WcaK-like protein
MRSLLKGKLLRRVRVWCLAVLVLTMSWIVRARRSAGLSERRTGRRLTIIGAYGNGNYGDDIIGEAIAASVVEFDAHPLIVARRSDTLRLSTETGAEVITTEDGLRGVFATWVALAGRTDAILGGGGLFEGKRDDVNVHRLVLEYAGKLMAAGVRGQRTIIHGIGISPNLYSDRLVSKAIASVLKCTDAVAVRDPASARLLETLGITGTLIRDPATSVLEIWAKRAEIRPRSVGVVVLDRHRWPKFVPGDRLTEVGRSREIRALAGRLVAGAERGDVIELFAFHHSDEAMVEDLAAAYRTAGGTPSSLTVVPYRQVSSQDPFLRLMACESVLSMRFHPALAALTAGRDVQIIGGLQKLEMLKSVSADIPLARWSYPESFADPVSVLNRGLGGQAGR